ncbi:6638_t:CDS:2, partial [Acaulospora colombiana]
MPPRLGRTQLRVQNPDNDSGSSEGDSDQDTRYYANRGVNGVGHLKLRVPLSPASTGNNTLQSLAIQTPVSPLPLSNSLPSHSHIDNIPMHFNRSHERRPSDTQRPFPNPTADQPRVIKVLASSDGGERWATVDLADARSALLIKERLFAK